MKCKNLLFFIFFIGLMSISIAIRAQDYLVDPSFNPTIGGRTHPIFAWNRTVVIQPDRKILVGGNFTTVNGASSPLIARLNPDGSRDTTFNSPLGAADFDEVETIKLLPDGKMYISGTFRVAGNPTYFIRLNSDGSVDSSFSFSVVGRAKAIETYSDGRFMACGGFQLPNGPTLLARFNPDGSVDKSFQVNLNGNGCYDVKLLPNGSMYAGGAISGIDGMGVRGLVKLNSDGSRDTTFNLPTENFNFLSREFYRLALQPDGNLIASYMAWYVNSQQEPYSVTGFNRYSPTGTTQQFANCGLADSSTAIFLQDDGRIITNGCRSGTNVPQYYFARLLPDGSFDASLNRLDFNATPLSIARQADGNYIVSGYFNMVDDIPRQRIVRLISNLTTARNIFDFDGDGKTDVSIFRPSVGQWWYQQSFNNVTKSLAFGNSTDKIVPADYDADGKTDIAFWRPSTGEWFVLRSSNLTFFAAPFGANGDVPSPGDFDGDGISDLAVFRSGTWFILKSTGGVQTTPFGINGDIPTVADYDGDGKSDIAIYRPVGGSGQGEWWIQRSSAGLFATPFGSSTDKPVQGDYTGDGKADAAFFRPSTGEWYVLRSEDLSFYAAPFGASGDTPIAGDYDGDGKFDFGVFRPSSATWFIAKSTGGTLIQTFGAAGDKPVPSAYVP